MARIETENPELDKILHRMEALVLEGGGWLNPNLIIRERDGALSIEMETPPNQDEKLIALNRDLLLPVNRMEIAGKGGSFDVKPSKPGALSKVKEELTELVFSIYNITGKFQSTRDTDFWLTMRQAPDLMDKVLAARTIREPAKKFIKNAKDGFEGEQLDKFVTNRFVASRVLGFGDGKFKGGLDAGAPAQPDKEEDVAEDIVEKTKREEGSGEENLGSVIMPFIDFFNHHGHGSRFISQTSNDLHVRHLKPLPDTNECYAFYGVMDPLDTFMRYGFVDEATTIIRSVPLVINLPNIGRIEAFSAMPAKNKKLQLGKKNKDLEEFLPVIRKNKDMLTVSHLFIPVVGSPMALRRVLGICISHLLDKPLPQEKHLALIHLAEEQVKDENVRFFRQLREDIELEATKNAENAGVKAGLHLARVMEDLVRGYRTARQAA